VQQTLGPTPDQSSAMDQLVWRGTLTGDQASAVRAVLWPPGSRPAASATNPAAVLIEVAGYVGGALMLGGAGLLVTLQWSQLGRHGATTVLIGYTLALMVAAVLVAGGPHRIVGLRDGRSPVRRRLVGVLLAFSAVPAAWATGLSIENKPTLPAGLVGLAVALLAYILLPTVPAVLAMATMSAVAVGGALSYEPHLPRLAPMFAYVGLGVLWALISLVGLIRPRRIGLALAAAFAIGGAQLANILTDSSPWAYGLTMAAALLCFVLYWLERATVLLAFGVIGATIAVPEAVVDWTNNSLGGPAILLISGAVLIAASALGLWLRQESAGPRSGPAGPRSARTGSRHLPSGRSAGAPLPSGPDGDGREPS
jgi:hypothetical protein